MAVGVAGDGGARRAHILLQHGAAVVAVDVAGGYLHQRRIVGARQLGDVLHAEGVDGQRTSKASRKLTLAAALITRSMRRASALNSASDRPKHGSVTSPVTHSMRSAKNSARKPGRSARRRSKTEEVAISRSKRVRASPLVLPR